MKYKPTYGDKQRDAQRRRKEEELRNRQVKPESQQEKTPPAENVPDNPRQNKDVA